MTIPIKPGPFSFLVGAGEALGRFAEAREDVRQTRRREAQERANSLLALRAAGLMSPAEFRKPEIQELFTTAGYGIPSSEPTSAERVEDTRRRFMAPEQSFQLPMHTLAPGLFPVPVQQEIHTAGPKSVSAEQRLMAGLPTESQVATEEVKTGVARRQAQTMRTGTDQQRDALAGVPDALTLRTEVESNRDRLYNSLAERSVEASITRAGGMLTPLNVGAVTEEAWRIAQNDAKMRGYTATEELTRPYIEATVSSILRQQEMQRLQIAARAQSGSQDAIRYLRDQMNSVRQQIALTQKPTDIQMTAANGFQARLNRATTEEERQQILNDPKFSFGRAALDAVQQYNETITRLTKELEGYRDVLQGAISTREPDIPGPIPGREDRKLSEAQVDAVVQRMRQQNIPASQIDKDVQAGLITAADGALIKQKLQSGAARTTGATGRF